MTALAQCLAGAGIVTFILLVTQFARLPRDHGRVSGLRREAQK